MTYSWEVLYAGYRQYCRSQRIRETQDALLISLCEQKLWHLREGHLLAVYTCSGSPRPPSCIENSLATPLGLHEVAEKYGDDTEPGTVFVARVSTGELYHQRSDAGPQQKALITTRILRLRGLEPGKNSGPGVDTYNRFIYIHGTNHPEKFPTPHSAGCLHLTDTDLIQLYNSTPLQTQIHITE